ncbi:MAG: hypothetical protein LBF57_02275, partial [Holosporaceae bacterium]|nr:hypothetical protein [Holosporaceae bacterium]
MNLSYSKLIKAIKGAWVALNSALTRMQRGGGNAHGRRRFSHFLGWFKGKNLDNFKGRNNSYLFLKNGIFRHRIFGFGSEVRGAILVEFAFSIPILLAILYYMHDIPKYARMKERMEFCVHCAINMLQNCSQNRENKRITRTDLMTVAHAAWLPFFGGGTQQYSTSSTEYRMKRGYLTQLEYYCVKGVGNGQAKLCWLINTNCALGLAGNVDILGNRASRSPIKCSTGGVYSFDDIYEGFRVEENEIKILVLVRIYCGMLLKFADGTPSSTKSMSSKLGLWVLSIKPEYEDKHYVLGKPIVVVFSPKPGLFDETPP